MVSAAEDHLRQLGCLAVDMIVLSLRPDLPPLYRRFGYVEVRTEEMTPVRTLKPGQKCTASSCRSSCELVSLKASCVNQASEQQILRLTTPKPKRAFGAPSLRKT